MHKHRIQHATYGLRFWRMKQKHSQRKAQTLLFNKLHNKNVIVFCGFLAQTVIWQPNLAVLTWSVKANMKDMNWREKKVEPILGVVNICNLFSEIFPKNIELARGPILQCFCLYNKLEDTARFAGLFLASAKGLSL